MGHTLTVGAKQDRIMEEEAKKLQRKERKFC